MIQPNNFAEWPLPRMEFPEDCPRCEASLLDNNWDYSIEDVEVENGRFKPLMLWSTRCPWCDQVVWV